MYERATFARARKNGPAGKLISWKHPYIKNGAISPLLTVFTKVEPAVVTEGNWDTYQLARELLFGSYGTNMTRRVPIIVMTATAFALTGVGGSATASPQKKEAPATRAEKKEVSSLTGCIDQQDERFVLVDERNMKPIANLEADGFPTEGFAKHVGHKVTVRGTSKADGEQRLFKVRGIEAISETCAPETAKQ
jgi:hypothetical protein